MDEHISKKVAPYAMMKYPMNKVEDVSKALNQQIQSVDDREAIVYDLLLNCDDEKVDFTFREDGIYNDIIMRFINWLIKTVNKEQNTSKQSLFDQFEKSMSSVFERACLKEEPDIDVTAEFRQILEGNIKK